MNQKKNIFRDKLYDFESPLGSHLTFEKAMARRKTPATPVWWKPTLLVVATLSVVTLTGYFYSHSNHGADGIATTTAIHQNQQTRQPELNSGNSEIGNSKLTENPDAAVTRSPQTSNTGMGLKTNRSGQKPERTASVEHNPIAGIETSGKENISENEVANRYSFHAFGIRTRFAQAFWTAHNKKLKSRFPDPIKEKGLPKPSFELMMATGGKGQSFDPASTYSIRGNHYAAQYSVAALWNLGAGIQLGGGFSFAQHMGNGEWRRADDLQIITIDTQIITIIQPGLPDKKITVYDTTLSHQTVVSSGDVSYRLNKIAVPLAFRWYFGEGRTIYRISTTVSPGLIQATRGTMFNNGETRDATTLNSRFVMDARVGAGVEMTLSKHFSFMLEPSVSYQVLQGSSWKKYNKAVAGFGFGLMIKP